LPLVPAGLIGVVGAYIDRLSIQHFMTQADVGLFGAGFRIASIGGVALVGLQMAFVPLLYSNAKRPEAPAEIARVFQYFVGAAALFCVTAALFAQEIARIVLTPAYAKSAGVIPLLAPAVIFANMTMFAPGLSLAKRTRQLAVVVSIGALANGALNALLVPMLGIRGAALSTLLSAAATFGVLLMLSQRYFAMPLRTVPLISVAFMTLVISGAAATLGAESEALLIVKVVVWVAAVAVLLLTKVLDVSGLGKLRQVAGA
jgi:O-antigen/teichoic acid export membrane protein